LQWKLAREAQATRRKDDTHYSDTVNDAHRRREAACTASSSSSSQQAQPAQPQQPAKTDTVNNSCHQLRQQDDTA